MPTEVALSTSRNVKVVDATIVAQGVGIVSLKLQRGADITNNHELQMGEA